MVVPFDISYGCLLLQGIDIKQSVVNVLGETSDNVIDGPSLQHQINLRALNQMNAYCHACKPVMVSREEFPQDITAATDVHPLLETLKAHVDNESVFRKNIDALIEAERVCKMLHGVRYVSPCQVGSVARSHFSCGGC